MIPPTGFIGHISGRETARVFVADALLLIFFVSPCFGFCLWLHFVFISRVAIRCGRPLLYSGSTLLHAAAKVDISGIASM